MRKSTKSDSAETGTSAMIIFITLVLTSSIISAMILGVGENLFSKTKTDSQQNVPSVKGIAHVIILEIFELGADDELHLVYELPYIEQELPEEDMSWVVMCVPPNQVGRTTVEFDEGDFSLATELEGDGQTALPLEEFSPGVTYRLIIPLDECDLNDIDEASFVIMIERGRTHEWKLDIGEAPYQGQDLI